MPEKPSTLGRFIRGTFSTGIGSIITILMGFLCTIIYTRWIPIAEFGTFVLFQLILSLVIPVSSFGIDYSVSKFIASTEDDIEKRWMINTVLIFRTATLVFATVVILVTRSVIENIWGPSLTTNLLLYLPILLIVETYSGNIEAVLSGNLRFKIVGITASIYSITSFLLTFVFIIWFNLGIMGLIIVRILSRVLALIYQIISARLQIRLEFEMGILIKMLRFGLPLYLNGFLNFGFTKADSLIIGGFLGPAEIALYEIARKIPDSIAMLYNAFNQVYFPIVSKFHANGDNEKVSRILNYSNRMLTIGGILFSFIAFHFRREIIVGMFSEQYLASAPIFAFLMFGLVIIILDNSLGVTLVAVGASDKPPMINILRTAISFGGYFLLIPTLGIGGAALSNTFATMVVNPINVYFLRKNKIKALMADYLKPILLFIIIIEFAWIFGWLTWVWIFLTVPLFLCISFLIRIFTLEDMTTLWIEIKKTLGQNFRKQKVDQETPGEVVR